MVDLEELVFANRDDVRVLLERVLNGVVGRLRRDSARIEHPPVTRHGNGRATHVLRFQRAVIYLLLKLQHRARHGRCALRRVTSLAVIPVRVEVADVRCYGAIVREVRRVVPPLVDPVFVLRIILSGDEALLEFLALTAGLCELCDSFLCRFELLLAENWVDGLMACQMLATVQLNFQLLPSSSASLSPPDQGPVVEEETLRTEA